MGMGMMEREWGWWWRENREGGGEKIGRVVEREWGEDGGERMGMVVKREWR